jgi:glycosyltransferase involved in cell wall biosynthesis
MPHISVIVPTHNSKQTIAECLAAIKKSLYADYELLVVDCASDDGTDVISRRYTDKVILLAAGATRNDARSRGFKESRGEIIVNVDSDVIIKEDALSKIAEYFNRHRETAALTGILSKKIPQRDFFSQYKNLYMHYIFSALPESVSFLYGSLYALRSSFAIPKYAGIKLADDTALGQELHAHGIQIDLVKELEVTHLKKYTFLSFLKNDFQIPFDWAMIFLIYRGWKQVGGKEGGFAHASRKQLISVLLAPVILILAGSTCFGYNCLLLLIPLSIFWVTLNARFFSFLIKEKGLIFGALGILLTFVDHIVMALGVFSGFLYAAILPSRQSH